MAESMNPFENTLVVCSICNLEKVEKSFEIVTQNCIHANITCTACVTKHLKVQSNYGETMIKCPNCESIFQKLDIKRFVSEEDFNKYIAAFAKSDDFHYCLHLRCGSGQKHFAMESSIMTCDKCSGKTCLKHGRPLKQDFDCRFCELDRISDSKIKYLLRLVKRVFSMNPETPEEQAERKEIARLRNLKKADKKSKRFISRNTKACPSCGVRIQKWGGCNRIRCWSCHNHFFWKRYKNRSDNKPLDH
ncbi:2685_t:CDS:2 [Ambispora leptoticha]|uniref:RBR-type E3 ubiquitin transferase n=1 Tax=Ambispora leptoticha TaxID=144679 RepID=A0A9N9CMQ9_9GLOM|nr:2685_t:CDS:2 [Ambispora leptoticha]